MCESCDGAEVGYCTLAPIPFGLTLKGRGAILEMEERNLFDLCNHEWRIQNRKAVCARCGDSRPLTVGPSIPHFVKRRTD